MKILVLGSGGREHALAWALQRDEAVTEVHVAPGNPGTEQVATNHRLDLSDLDAAVDLARDLAVDLVVVGPEVPLVAGIADRLRAAEIPCFGPSKAAAQLEGSKAFAKDVMTAAGVPTARARVCTTGAEVAAALDEFGAPYVVKDDALAAGKGVVVTESRDAALAHANGLTRVVVEDYLDGPEASLFVITDGETAVPLLPAQDFKRLGDGDEGPNTGGMGAYSPLPWAPEDLAEQVLEEVVRPTLAQMRDRGTPFSGLLYVGLALTSRGLRVIEFNARFGDPETQAILPLITDGLALNLLAAATGRLAEAPPLSWSDQYGVVVVMASDGYPWDPRTGAPVQVPSPFLADGRLVFHAGTAMAEDQLVTSGGRVLGAVGIGEDLTQARERAYAQALAVHFPGSVTRSDIARQAADAQQASRSPYQEQ